MDTEASEGILYEQGNDVRGTFKAPLVLGMTVQKSKEDSLRNLNP